MSRACPRPGLRKLLASWVLKPDSHGTPSDDVGLDAGFSRREGTGLWGWLWGPWRFSPAPRGYVHMPMKLYRAHNSKTDPESRKNSRKRGVISGASKAKDREHWRIAKSTNVAHVHTKASLEAQLLRAFALGK